VVLTAWPATTRNPATPGSDEGLATYGESPGRRRPSPTSGAGRFPAYGRGHLGEVDGLLGPGRRLDLLPVGLRPAGVQALGALADRIGRLRRPSTAPCRRYVHDRAYTVSKPADLIGRHPPPSRALTLTPILAPLGVN